jgi:hypothetical protein
MQIITKHPEISVAYFIIFAVFTHTKVLPANENCGIVVFTSRREYFCCVNASLRRTKHAGHWPDEKGDPVQAERSVPDGAA